MAQLTQHKEKCHSKMILCKYCVTRCASLDDLKKHVSSVHSFQCNLCPALFVELALLTCHKEKKNHPANFGCNYCFNRFSTLVELNNHIKNVHSLVCDTCS